MKMYELKLTSALVIAGNVVRAGTKVEVNEATAKDFLRRGKAELVSQPDADDASVDLSKLKKPELVEAATALGIDGAGKMTVAELVEAIEAKSKETE